MNTSQELNHEKESSEGPLEEAKVSSTSTRQLSKPLLFYLDWLTVGFIAALLFLLPLAWYPWAAGTFFTIKFCVLITSSAILLGLAVVRFILFKPQICPKLQGSLCIRVPVIFSIVGLFWLWNLLTCFSSVQVSTAVLGRHNSGDGIIFLTANLVLFGAIFTMGLTQNQETVLRRISILAGVIICGIGFLQLFGLHELLLTLGLGSVKSNWRVSGTLGNPVYFGGYLILVLPLILPSILKSTKASSLVPSILGVALFFFFVIVSFSRAAWVALFAGLLVFFIVLKKERLVENKQRALLLGITFMLILVIGSLASLTYQKASPLKRALTVAQLSTPTTATRLEIWKGSVAAVRDKPLLGWGPGCARYAFNQHSTLRKIQLEPQSVDGDAHNFLFTTAINTGLPGILMFMCVVLFITCRGWAIARTEVQNDNLVPAAIFAGIIGFFVHQLFNPPSVGVTPIMWVFVGWLLQHGYVYRWDERSGRFLGARFVFAFLFLGLVLIGLLVPVLRLFRADCSYLSAMISKSRGDAKEAVANNPYYEEYHDLLSKISASQALASSDLPAFWEALRIQRQVIKRNPMEVESYFSLGDMYMSGNSVFVDVKLGPAIEAFEKGLKLRPNSAYGHARLGQCYLREKKYALARKHLSYSLKIFSGNPGVWLAMGNVEEAAGNKANAKKYYKKALLIDPNFYEAKKALEKLKDR